MSIVDIERNRPAEARLRVIDCDIHPSMTAWTEVHPYLARQWIEHLSVYGSHLRHAFSEALTHPRMSPDAARVDAHRFYERLGFQASHVGMKLAL